MADNNGRYASIWRWHFYAGLIIAPVLIIMSVTGAIYLLQPQLEDALYGDRLYLTTPYEGSVNHDALIQHASTALNAARIHTYQPPTPNMSAQLELTDISARRLTAYMDPATGNILGTVNEAWRPTAIARSLHGGLMLGTPGEVIVELVACWTLVLVITGLYLWWPRTGRKQGVLVPLLGKSGRSFWRELHAVPGAWAGLWIMAIIITGLPWSVVWGGLYSAAGQSINEALPAQIFSERPHSSSDMSLDEVSMNTLMETINRQNINHAFEIQYPWFQNGVYTVMPQRQGGHFEDMAYVFLDKRTGAVLLDLRWNDLGALGRASSIGVQFHEGRLFGPANQVINLIAIVALIGLALIGPIMWWKRRPPGQLAAPQVSRNLKVSATVLAAGTVLAVLLPLFGLSVLLILAGETAYARWQGRTTNTP